MRRASIAPVRGCGAVRRGPLQHRPIDCDALTDTYIALLAVVADKAVVDTTPHLAHFRVNPVCGSLICLQDTKDKSMTRRHLPQEHCQHHSRHPSPSSSRHPSCEQKPPARMARGGGRVFDGSRPRTYSTGAPQERSDLFMFTPQWHRTKGGLRLHMCREKHNSMVMKGSEEEKGGTNKDVLSYPARCFSFLSSIPSLDTSLLNTRIPITMFTCRQRKKTTSCYSLLFASFSVLTEL